MFNAIKNNVLKMSIFSILFLFNLIFADPTDGCELSSNEVFLTSTGDVLYNVPDDDIGGFQFNVDGATFLSASGGDAQTAGFVIQGGGSTVLAFSFTGSVVPAGCGTLTSLALDGDATGLSGLVFSDGGGLALNVTYYAGPVLGCVDETACNYNSAAEYDDGSCEYPLENYDCEGDCNNDVDQDGVCDEDDDCVGSLDCNDVCNGQSEVDECGVCDGGGIADGACDCDGNTEDICGTCGGTATSDDECGPPAITDGCQLSDNNLYLNDGNVLYNSTSDIAGFQFVIDGATASAAADGDAASAGFTVQAAGSTVLGFSFTGSTVPAGCGTLTTLTLSGDATGLSSIVISDTNGQELDFEYYAGPVLGCMDQTACNYNAAAEYDDGSCEYDDGITNCDGDCYNDEDQDDVCDENDDCVGLLDVCGVCDGLATNLSQCLEFYDVVIEGTGESTLFIFENTITTLDAGDEIGLFDSNGVIDNTGNIGEVLVGAGVWQGTQLNIVAISSQDLSQFGGPILPGSVSGNELAVKVWDSSEQVELSGTTYDIESGTGSFDALFTVIGEVYLCDIPEGECDCDGNVLDECGVCGGDGAVYECGCYDILEGTCDCDGNIVDACGVCAGEATDDDEDGICDDVDDCVGDYDPCGVCNGAGVEEACDCIDTSGLNEDGCCDDVAIDCFGVCGGDSLEDNCGTCDNNPDNDCLADCNGDFGGLAYVDECGSCVLSADPNCIQDCAGVWGGESYLDVCGICDGPGYSLCWDDSEVCNLNDCPPVPHFLVDIEETGESTLFIFQDTITTLEVGDEIGLFDSNGVVDSEVILVRF